MRQLVIQSTNPNDSPAAIEEILYKAVSALQEKQEKKPIKDKFLREQAKLRDNMFHKVINNMIKELKSVMGVK